MHARGNTYGSPTCTELKLTHKMLNDHTKGKGQHGVHYGLVSVPDPNQPQYHTRYAGSDIRMDEWSGNKTNYGPTTTPTIIRE